MRQNDDFVAQLVEQLTLNQWAEGSSPSEVTENKEGVQKVFGTLDLFVSLLETEIKYPILQGGILPFWTPSFLFMLVFLLFKQVVLTNNHVPERFRKRPNYNDDSSQPITRISYIRH